MILVGWDQRSRSATRAQITEQVEALIFGLVDAAMDIQQEGQAFAGVPGQQGAGAGLSLEQAFAPLVVAIALGLFIGKQVGVFGAAWLAAKLKIGDKPSGASWLQLYGVSLLCGIGFTMSLFIGVLAFPGAVDSPEQIEVKLGVIGGSVLSALMAAAILTLAEKGRKKRMVAHQSNI